jgi:outer membrane protein OmpA-like peptidoglycan-associated protein
MYRTFAVLVLAACAACAVTPAPTPPSASAPASYLARPVVLLPRADDDSDGDGVVDTLDACPYDAGAGADGCRIPDTDGDGFLDPDDRCRDEPGVEPDGCPIPDGDGDGILNPDDHCLSVPETRNGYLDEDGCPDEIPKDLIRVVGIVRGIDFGADHKLLPRSYRVLDRVAATLARYPHIRVEIAGHIDDTHGPQYGRDPSRNRANEVRSYLIQCGIGAERLETRGAGPDEPIGSNETASGRARNQRIEFTILVQ